MVQQMNLLPQAFNLFDYNQLDSFSILVPKPGLLTTQTQQILNCAETQSIRLFNFNLATHILLEGYCRPFQQLNQYLLSQGAIFSSQHLSVTLVSNHSYLTVVHLGLTESLTCFALQARGSRCLFGQSPYLWRIYQ